MKCKKVLLLGMLVGVLALGGCGEKAVEGTTSSMESTVQESISADAPLSEDASDSSEDTPGVEEKNDDPKEEKIRLKNYLFKRIAGENHTDFGIYFEQNLTAMDAEGNFVYGCYGDWELVQYFTDEAGNIFMIDSLERATMPKTDLWDHTVLTVEDGRITAIKAPDDCMFDVIYDQGVVAEIVPQAGSSWYRIERTEAGNIVHKGEMFEGEYISHRDYEFDSKNRVKNYHEVWFNDDYYNIEYYDNGNVSKLDFKEIDWNLVCLYNEDGQVNKIEGTKGSTWYIGKKYRYYKDQTDEYREDSLKADLDGDGKEENISIIYRREVDMDKYTLTIDNVSVSGESEEADIPLRLLEIGNRTYIGVMDAGPSEDPVTTFYAYENGTIVTKGKIYDDITPDDIEENKICTRIRNDIIETSFYKQYYQSDESGKIVAINEEDYEYFGSNPILMKELPLHETIGGETFTIQPQAVYFKKISGDWKWIYVENEEHSGWMRVEHYGKIVDLNKEAGEVFDCLNYAD